MSSSTADSTGVTADSTLLSADQVQLGGAFNVVYTASLQAPLSLSNPTGALSLASDLTVVAAQANPVPIQASMSLVGIAVRLALAMRANVGTAAFAGATASVISGTVTPRNPSVGTITAAGAAPSCSITNATNTLTFPRVMLVGVGGDQSYGSNSGTGFPAWTTAAAGSAANTAIQTIAAYDVAIISGVNEGWDTNGARDRENLTQALLKNATYAVTKNTARPTQTFYYEIMNATVSGNPYTQWQALVDAHNWYLYESIGGVGTKTPAGGGQSFINYSAAWPGAIGSAGIGASICGTNYGTTRTGSPTGSQGPARTFGNYAAIKLLMRGFTGDSSFSFNVQMGSPSASGIFLDECFVALDCGGNVPDSSVDGLSIAPGSQQGGGFPGLDTVQPCMARGNRNMFDQIQVMLSTYGTPGKTYYNFANFGSFANRYQFGAVSLTCGLESTLHGGLLENAVGAGASSWECFQIGNTNTGNTTYASGWPNLLANYYQGMDFCLSPKLVGLGAKLPATDGSQTASWPVGAGTTLSTVSTGTALEYQLMRYSLCTTLLDDGYYAAGVTGYDWSKVRWYDEYGDDSLAQVNVKRGYLGAALTARPNSPTWAQGTLGVWSRSFANGMAIVNPRGNGAQTVTLPMAMKKLAGTQQPSINNGAVVTSVSLLDGDGIVLVTAPSTNTDYTWSAIVTGSAKSAAAGFIAPVIFNNGTAINAASYQGGRIFPVSGPCTVDVYYERVLGETGSLSVTISTFTSTNSTAGTHYTALSGTTLTWADGEIGWKKVSIPILSIPTGFGLVGITCSGAAAYRPTSWIWLRGTGRVPGAKFFQSSNGVNVNGNVSGSGTQGSPWQGLSHAISSMGAAGGVLYWVQNGTNGHMEWGGTAGANNGITVNGFNASISNPLIILPDPGNTSVALMDQGSTSGGAGITFSNAPALYYLGTGSNMWLVGIHFYRGGIQHNSQDVLGWTSNVIWQCEVDNYSVNAGSNVHCVRFDYTKYILVQDSYIHDSYTTEQGTGIYPYSSVASGAESCAGAFYSGGATFAHCKFSHGQNAVMYKQASNTITDTPPELTHCVASQCCANASAGGYLIQYPVQIAAYANGVIRYCVYDGTNDTVNGAGLLFYASGENAASSHVDVYNCVSITSSHGGGGLGVFVNANHIRIFNCISQDSTTINDEMKIGASPAAQLEISDYNLYVRGSHTWYAGYSGGTVYSTLSSWQAAPAGTYLQYGSQDAHSTATSVTPAYGNIAVGNYIISNSGGRGNRPIGVGNQFTGIVNNFLNSNLPVVS